MKRLRTLFAMSLVTICASAQVVIGEIDWSQQEVFNNWCSLDNGSTAVVGREGLEINVPSAGENYWNPQTVVLNIPGLSVRDNPYAPTILEEDGFYRVVITAKHPAGHLNVGLGSWDDGVYLEKDFDVNEATDFEDIVVDFSEACPADCFSHVHVLWQSGSLPGLSVIKNVEVYKVGSISTSEICYNFIAENKTAEVIANSERKYEGTVLIPEIVMHNGEKYTVTNIGDGAFDGCSDLISITMPNTVTSIGVFSFAGCSGLTSITIPNSVTNIESVSFYGCSGLTSIVVEGDNTIYDSRDGCNAIVRRSDNVLIAGCKNTIIPNSVTSIGNNAFSGCSGLTSIMIPNSVTSIGSGAFQDCSSLTSIMIPNSVTGIEIFTFSGCSSLTSITIPNNVTRIGGGAFAYCSGLTSITIPQSVTSIWAFTFEYCSGLTSVTIPNSVTSIMERAFNGCSGLTSISIPNSVTTIGEYAFGGCSNLTTIIIPNSVTRIGSKAFYDCSGLTSVTIGNSVANIGDCAFSNNGGLTDVYCYSEIVPSVISYIEEYEYDDEELTRGTRGYVVGELVSDYSHVTLHVPSGSVKAYAETAPWNKFKLIIPIEEDDLQDYLNSLHDTQDLLSDGIYTRQFLNTDWQSLYVPFSLSYSDWCNNFEVASLSRFCQYDDNADGVTDRHELEAVIMRLGSDVLKANTPYLIRAKKTGTYYFTEDLSRKLLEHINSVTYSANGAKMVITGNYTNQSGLKSANRYRLMGGSLSIPTKDEEVLPPYRWYATIENSDKAKVRITFVDDATGIESINVDAEEMIGERRVYDLSGRRINISKDTPISSLPKGVYIINNKKVLIK